MRLHVLLALTAGLLLAANAPKAEGAENDAEKMFRNMEEKLAKAATLELVFEGKLEVEEGKESSTIRRDGSLLLAEGSRMRLEIKEEAKAETTWRLMVSNGARMKVLDKGSDPQVQTVPKSGNSEVLTWVTRAGLLLPQMPLPDVEVTDGKDRYSVSDFRLGNKEKVGERQTQRLEYQLVVKGHPGTFAVTVWLDTKTDLPVKRLITFRMPGHMATLTEGYTKLTLNGEVDGTKFELSE
jgi:outer membrane lipoprotein-sorting protein